MSAKATTLSTVFGLLTGPALIAAGGKWTPEQLREHDPAWLRQLGLELPADALWDAGDGGLLDAVVQIGGCSAGFVSADGLLITNHHCVFSILQQHATAERDLIRDGFLAADREHELPGAGVRVSVPHRRTDVTAEIEAVAAAAGDDDLARYRAIDRRSKELVAACEAQPFRRCRFATYDDGVRYELIERRELRDVRLVYAPPRAIGEFGGEVDNWMWPRHAGDFALARVYAAGGVEPAVYDAGNRPYRPRRHLEVAPRGVSRGAFVMVAGYPGSTRRAWLADEVAERLERFYPRRSALYRAWLDRMTAAQEADPAARIALADRVKRLANREKNARGQVAGLRRGDLVAVKRRQEQAVRRWAAEQPQHAAAVGAHGALVEQAAAARATWERDFLLDELDNGSLPLAMAITLARWSLERAKPDLARDPAYQERNRERLWEDLERGQKRLWPATERELLADLLGRLAALPPEQALAAIDSRLGDASGDRQAAAEALAGRLLDATRVPDLETRRAMFDDHAEALRARRDPLLDLAFDLCRAILDLEERRHRRQGAVSRVRPAWRRAVAAHGGRPLDPDANGTLRVSLARVAGYRPRDGVLLEPQTRLAGVLEKHTGEAPFDAPAWLREAAAAAPQSRFADPALGDLPVCFLADGDTTGGSSGSPVLDGRGRLVGVNFDRVWENVANDYGYHPAIARNVSADLRYLLWLLDGDGSPAARALLAELLPAGAAAPPAR